MKFNTYQDWFSFLRQEAGERLLAERFGGATPEAMYRHLIANNTHGKWDFLLEFVVEAAWWNNGRPYYNVWPCMLDAVLGFAVERVPAQAFLAAPEKHMAVQLPVGANAVRSLLISVLSPLEQSVLWGQKVDSWALVVNEEDEREENQKNFDGSPMPEGEFPTRTSLMTLTPANLHRPIGELLSTPIYDAQRAAIAVLLMERDPSIIEPDILAADRDRYELADADRRAELAERAFKRRGQRGYHVGRLMETIPHYRRPHPCLVWTGKGRATAKVVMRAGAVVKRQRMTEAPTGYYGAFGEAEHDAEVV